MHSQIKYQKFVVRSTDMPAYVIHVCVCIKLNFVFFVFLPSFLHILRKTHACTLRIARKKTEFMHFSRLPKQFSCRHNLACESALNIKKEKRGKKVNK